ncbi:MAG: hypothetical protein K2J67_12640 [Lachnospiraceae bacterium]|nr:hypothetical protein [Lachnospiraceae bacterium]
MKKWKQAVLVAAIALILGLSVKAETQAAITGVKQTDAGTSSVSVSSGTDLLAKYYVLFISTDQNIWVEKDYSSSPNNLSASGLSAGSTYYAQVRGASDYDFVNGERVWEWATDPSAVLEVVTVPDTSTAKVVQTGATLNSITMQLSGVSGANYYFLGSSGIYSSAQVYAASTTPTITAGNLNPNTSYTMYAYACRKAATTGFIAHSSYDADADYSAKTLSSKINTNNFGVTGTYSNINVYYFGIASGLQADGYQFQFQTLKGKVKKDVVQTSNSLRLENFINGTFYKYRVRSYVDCGTNKAYGAWSDFRFIGMSKNVSGVSKTRGSKRTIRCSWKKVTGASGYVVYISKSQTGGFKKVKSLSSKKNSIVITKIGKKKLKKNTRYYVRIVTKGKNGKKAVTSDVNTILSGS